jgi:glycosyltransferase involved in cell wall biosynthesis
MEPSEAHYAVVQGSWPVRILFVSLAVPFPPTNGHRIRNWILLRGLTAEGHAVSLVSFAEAGELEGDPRRFQDLCRDVELVPSPASVSGWRGHAERLRAIGSTLPFGVRRFRSEAMRRAVRDVMAVGSFDCVICDDIYNVENVGDTGRVPVLLNKHDLTHVILRRFAGYARNPLQRAYAWLEYRKLRRWEAHACRLPGVLACSDADRRALLALVPSARIEIVPNAIDTESYPPAPGGGDGPATVLYFGSMDWYPNIDAVAYFAAEILPELERRVPGVRFRVAGRNPPRALCRRFARAPVVEFSGTVSDIRAEIAAATVCVVPLRIGSGTRLKILEAGAMEKAIVSTRIGAEGLDFEDGADIILADEPLAFARAVADLLADPARRRELGHAARRRVERDYSLPAVRAAFRHALPRLVGNRA